MKRLRQDARRRLRNRSAKSRVRTVSKKVRSLAEQGKTDEAINALVEAYSVIDSTAKKGILRKETASRQKSRLARAVDRSAADKKTAADSSPGSSGA